jgi:heavy metal translocating P-type ATPase
LAWSRDTYIALLVFVFILLHLLLRFGLHRDARTATLPLFVALLTGIPLVFDLLRKLVRREFGSDLIAGVSVVSAVLMHEYLVASVVILMLSGGQALENYATRKASSVLRALAQRTPTEAHRLNGSNFEDISAGEIHLGDVLLLFPHEICPVDGEVIEGHGRMDESFLTGEPFELSKAPGAQVLSGAINGDTLLTIRALRVPEDSRYARILKVIEQTEENQPRIRRIGDRLGAWYTPFALGLAGLGWLLSGNPERFLAVAVIATPCPLLLAIPVAILGGISLAARRGIIVRNAAVLEQIDSCRSFIFDKTGTLTYGRPVLNTIFCAAPYHENEVLSFAASLENYSRHPLARGILEAARQRRVAIFPPSQVMEHPGDGLRGTVEGHAVHITGRTKAELRYGPLLDLPACTAGLECLLFVDGKFAAQLTFRDELKDESVPFLQHLRPKHRAQRLILLSGDKESAVRHVAAEVGINEIYFGKSPEEKLAFVEEQTRNEKTLFVGDGINDAPSMLAATVGVALGGSSAAISESADAVVLDASLRKIDELIHIGRRMKTISLQSAVGGMLLSAIGMIAAATGLLSPLAGAIGQEGIDLIVVLNAIRVPMVKPGLADF